VPWNAEERRLSRSWTKWVTVVALSAAACVATPPDARDETSREEAAAPADAVEEAVWSADGRRLAATWTQRGRTRLFGLLAPVEGERPAVATGLPLAEGEAGWGSWSPDGLWVAYAAGREGGRDVVRARPDGTGAENLTPGPGDDFDPAYSPDGRTLAFISTRDGGTPKLHLMNADGSDVRLLVDLPGPARHPAWSPDGRTLAVQVTDLGEETVYVVTPAGRGFGPLGPGRLPAWFPDGRRVVFTENDSLFWRPSEGGARRLLLADARAGRPSPAGRWVAVVRGDARQASLYLLDEETGELFPLTRPPE